MKNVIYSATSQKVVKITRAVVTATKKSIKYAPFRIVLKI